MARKHNYRPSFFKVLISRNFTHQLGLPPAFTAKYGAKLPGNAKLKISCGATWEVRVEQLEDEQYYFTKGWNEFAKDLELKLFEFLVFWFNIGKSTLDVYIYGTNACEKESRYLVSPNFDEDEYETKPDPYYPRFEMVLKKHHQSRVSIGKQFAQLSGLIDKKKVGLEYPGGQNVCAVLVLRSTESHFKLDLAAGWPEFRKANGLISGKRYSFEFISSKNAIRVQQIEGKK